MKMKRRMLSVCLSALMLGAAVPYLPMANTAVFADSGDVVRSGQFRYEIGTNWVATPQNTVEAVKYVRILGCDKDVTDLVIPAELDGMPVLKIGREAFEGDTSITSVTIPESVDFIGDYAFAECTSIKSITLPDTLPCIASGTFYGCSSLTSVHIPDSVTEIGMDAFNGCTSLKSITIPDSVTKISWSAFYESGLESVTVPGSVKTIEWSSFSKCDSLKSVTLSEGVKTIGPDTFQHCTALTSLSLPDSLETIGSFSFYGCTALSSVTIPKNVKTIDTEAFAICSQLEEFNVDAENPYFGSVDGVLFDKQDAKLVRYPCAKQEENYIIPVGVTGIVQGAFGSCKNLKSLTVPDTVTNFEPEVMTDFDADEGDNTVNNILIYCNPGSAVEAYAEKYHIPYAAASEEAKKVRLPFAVAAAAAVPQTDLTGDLNKDGSVNLKDVVLLRRYIAGGWDVAL